MSAMEIELRLMVAGYCTQHEAMAIRGGRWREIKFPALFALLIHPVHGPILFDTGYTDRFFTETQRWPASIYRRLTPTVIREEETAAAQLERLSIAPADVRWVILSHFHADHVAGVRDFPNARFLYLPKAYEAVRGLKGLAALKGAFLPGLLPDDFASRSQPVGPEASVRLPERFRPFEQGYDLFGDGSVLGVELTGHAIGQMGIIVQSGGESWFLCADAVWSSQAYRENRPPHPIVSLLLPDRRAYRANMEALHQLWQRQPEIRIIPTHCGEVWADLVPGGAPDGQ